MNLTKFYATYNLNKYEFAEIAGVGKNTLVKYANGKSIRSDSKERIEKAIRVAEKYNLMRPTFDYSQSFGFWSERYKCQHAVKVKEYKVRFKKLIEEES